MIEIRKAYSTDAYTLVRIHDEAWRDGYYDILPNGLFHDFVKSYDKRVYHMMDQIKENNRIFVALDDGKIIGYVFYAKSSKNVYSSSAEIRSICVLPFYQRKGIGKKLFLQAIDELKKLGFRSLVLSCPVDSPYFSFFLHLDGEKKEIIDSNTPDYSFEECLIYYNLDSEEKKFLSDDWNLLYKRAQELIGNLNFQHLEIGVILTDTGNFYYGLGIKNKVCPIEVCLSNMYLGGDKKIVKMLILNRNSEVVLPCGKCRDLLMELGQKDAEILSSLGGFKRITVRELNPYYKDIEKV